MSRIGKLPIPLPSGTSISVSGDLVTVKGGKGVLTVRAPTGIKVEQQNGNAIVTRPNDERQTRADHGLMRALLANAVLGVTSGFVRELEIQGVGYRAEAKGKQIHFTLGFSHPVVFDLPEGVSASTPAPTKIIVEGIDKQAVGMAAARIRDLRPPEPYKGKGIRYLGEYVRRKVGKTGA